jgi:hypothetical protein
LEQRRKTGDAAHGQADREREGEDWSGYIMTRPIAMTPMMYAG